MKPTLSHSIARLAPLFVLFAASFLPASLYAQTNGTWTNTAGGTWGTASNWDNSTIANGIGATADFSTLNIPANETVTLDANYTIGNLIFADTSGSSTWTIAGNNSTILTLATSSGTPTITTNTSATISTPLQGTQGFIKEGSGQLSITNGNSSLQTLSGPIEVAAGTLYFGSTNSVAGITSSITVDSGATLSFFGNYQSGSMTNALMLNGNSTFGISGNGLYNGTITLNGNATITHGGNTGTINGTITGDYILTLSTTYGGQPDLTVNASIQTGTGGLVVNALSTQQVVLAGNNTYTGATTVNTGHFIVNGKITSAVTVESGATFGGTGSSTQGINVLSGGIITGGGVGTVGTFTTTGAVTLASGSTFSVDFNSSTGTFDKLVASGFSLNGATLSLTDANSSSVALTLGTTYTLMSGSSSITGTFSGLTEGSLITIGNNTFQISYAAAGGDNVTLTTVSSIPEPAAAASVLAIVGALACLIARRRAIRA